MTLGDKIKAARKQKGWTQEQLAEKVHVTAQAVSSWELGKFQPIRTAFEPLSKLLGIPMEAFWGMQGTDSGVDKSALVLHDRMFSEEHMYTFVKSAASSFHMENTLKALPFMKEQHAGKFRKNTNVNGEKILYIYHPLMMACHALAMGLKDDKLIAAILLHDVVEDCPVPVDELPVDDEVKAAVNAVTKKEAAKAHDPAALAAYFANIAQNRYASMVKVLDRCNNVSCMAIGFTKEHMVEYINETETSILPLLENIKDKYPEYHDAAFLLKYQMLSILETIKRIL